MIDTIATVAGSGGCGNTDNAQVRHEQTVGKRNTLIPVGHKLARRRGDNRDEVTGDLR